MTGHQRITAALKGEWPDKRPIMLHNFMMAAHEAGINMKEYRSDPQKATQVHIDAVEKYDLDGVLIDFDTATLAAAVGVPVDNPIDEPSRCSGALLNSLENVDEIERIYEEIKLLESMGPSLADEGFAISMESEWQKPFENLNFLLFS